MKVLIIIPAYNEEKSLNRVIEHLKNTCPQYDYLIVNDDLESCVEQVHSILQNEHTKILRKESFINNMKAELAKYAKGEQS